MWVNTPLVAEPPCHQRPTFATKERGVAGIRNEGLLERELLAEPTIRYYQSLSREESPTSVTILVFFGADIVGRIYATKELPKHHGPSWQLLSEIKIAFTCGHPSYPFVYCSLY